MKKIWLNRRQINKEDILEASKKYGIEPALAAILLKRDIEDIGSYLNPGTNYLYDAMKLEGMDKAINLLYEAIINKTPIAIVNDYDVDGATSGCILLEGLSFLGASDLLVRTPTRQEGYGISAKLIDEIYDKGYRFIITCDNGISAIEQIKHAKELGMTVVITDHHEVPFEEINGVKNYIIPCADAVVDPKLPNSKYPFREICGASVAYKVISELMKKFDISNEDRIKKLTYFGELLALGTVADVMPLVDENRMYVKAGIELMKNSKIIGLRQLMDVQKLDSNNLKSYHLGFVIGPCINAASRITGSIEDGMKLLTEKDFLKSRNIAESLAAYNEKRKNLTEEGMNLALSLVDDSKRVNIIYLNGFIDSVCGIIAGRIKDITGKPTVIVSDTDEGFLKGSGRSVEGYDLFEEFSKYKDMFIAFGGHAGACGLSINKDMLNTFDKVINEEAEKLDDDIFIKKTTVDLFMPMSAVTEKFVIELTKMEPLGNGNPKPCFAEENVIVKGLSTLGENGLKIKVVSNNKPIECILFNKKEELLNTISSKYGQLELDRLWNNESSGLLMDFIYNPSINEWNGIKNLQFIIEDYK